jgi:hypothetical protein
MPHPDDVASAAEEGLPDGTTRDLLDILCQLSREHRIDWEISDDCSGGPIGYIRKGIADEPIVVQMEAFADLISEGPMAEFETKSCIFPPSATPAEEEMNADDDEPPNLPFRPEG